MIPMTFHMLNKSDCFEHLCNIPPKFFSTKRPIVDDELSIIPSGSAECIHGLGRPMDADEHDKDLISDVIAQAPDQQGASFGA